MLFQPFQGLFFYEGNLFPLLRPECNQTWSHHPSLTQQDADYARVWAQGKSLSDVCPETFFQEFELLGKKMKSFIKSYQVAGIDVSSCDVRKIIPEKLLFKYLNYKNKICDHVFQNFEKPVNYEFMKDVHEFCSSIAAKPLKLNFEAYRNSPSHFKQIERLKKTSKHIKFDAYKTITGRLSTEPLSFPILNLKKELRGLIEPHNDILVELDFNAAELRVLLALSDHDQPDRDIHTWNAEHVFKDPSLTRDEIKRKTFSWLYNEKAVDKSLEICYNKKHVKNKYFNGSKVRTIFERTIETDEDHSLNYIIQSTTSDLFLKQAIKIYKFLLNKSSNIYFSIHDSLILDFSLEDKYILEDLISMFSNTELGKFKVNVSAGKNFGEMKELNL